LRFVVFGVMAMAADLSQTAFKKALVETLTVSGESLAQVEAVFTDYWATESTN